MLSKDWVMFVPACGEGTRVAERGLKPFLEINGVKAIDKVLSMAPGYIPAEIAFRYDMPLVDMPKSLDATLHLIPPTRGQAHTIYEWMKRTRKRNYVIISNCDNRIDPGSLELGVDMIEQGLTDCMVFTFRPVDKKDTRFSYVDFRNGELSKAIAEKKVVSDQACTGVYIATWEVLERCIWPTDEYFSASLTRYGRFKTYEVEHYMGWGDMQQLEEIETGIQQFTKE